MKDKKTPAPPVATRVPEGECPGLDVPGDRRHWYNREGTLRKKIYGRHLRKLQVELVKLQEWVRHERLKVVIVFEGRDASGKGGVIKRITDRLNPRVARIAALPAPTERERSQWYFQRYVAHLPAGGEMVLFDRSWYNRAGVERVMGYCTDGEYEEFVRTVPQFERMLVGSGVILLKYWFSISDEEQERRFQARIHHPMKRWKLSPTDLEARRRFREYSQAKDRMLEFSDIDEARWWIVPADDKRRARLNCIHHILTSIPYEDVMPDPMELPPRQDPGILVRPPFEEQNFIPELY